ncbi:TetR/AcrR family transcriptional regulator, partial [Leucobacter sp. M11]|uniref:TetR/AcrR family transcriptional regulator n=1 Tax=Leucobacter sp. M11 TaxID=2993565 RepID=UPI002D7F84DF
TLEEAAFELFAERGYAGTTVDDIAQRAGVSRNTFFNYFSAKSDVFWSEIDDRLALLPGFLAATDPTLPAFRAIGEALADAAGSFGPENVPWILTQYELIGSPAEVQASALSRFGAQAEVLRQFAAERLGQHPGELLPRVIAYTTVGAVLAAAQAWAAAGPGRGPLTAHLVRTLAPLADGFTSS